MKRNSIIFSLLAMLMVGIVSVCFVSCGDDPEPPIPEPPIDNTDAIYESKLKGTSWKQVKVVKYKSGVAETVSPIEGIMTFANDYKWYIIGLSNKYDGIGTWSIKDGAINVEITSNNSGNSNVVFRGMVVAANFLKNKIVILNDTKLRTEWAIDSDGSYTEFEKVSYREPSGGGGGGNSDGEAPRIIDYDFTATKTSITAKFMCNSRPTSATVKYGSSSPSSTISSSIIGNQVSATVSGLKSGTKYYFKCTVSNSYGSSTSDTYPAITDY